MKRYTKYLWACVGALCVGGGIALFRARGSDVSGGVAPPSETADAAPYKIDGEAIEVPEEAMNTAGVQTIEVKPRDLPVTLRLSGRTDLDSDRVAHVHAQFGGRVLRVGTQLGDAVRGPADTGGATALCVIESTDLAQAKSDYLKAKVQLQLDEENLARTRELLKSKVLADKYLLDAESAVTKSKADLEATRQRLLVFGLGDRDLADIARQQGRERMAYTIYSPRGGVVVEKGVSGGELADPAANLFTVADTSRLWVWGDVYERDRGRVKEGQKVQVIFMSQPDQPRQAAIEWVSPVVDPNTHSIRIRATLDNTDGRLLAAMYATLVVTVDGGENAVIVPADAVVRNDAGTYVFVRAGPSGGAGGTQRFMRTAVRVEPVDAGPGLNAPPPSVAHEADGGAAPPPPAAEGGARQQLVRIPEGLKPGSRVVTSGALGLFNEMEQQSRQ